jgi:endonuclease YncB( thermonuclease family)
MSAFFVAALLCLPALANIDCPPDRIDASHQVSQVIDGDTVRLRNGDKLRFIGINTPEIGRDGKASEPFAHKAKARLTQLLKSQNYTLNLRIGNEPRDRYKRLLAHVYLADNRSINAILLREGLAVRVTIPPNVRDFRCYQKAEWQARKTQRGFWSLAISSGENVTELAANTRGFRILSGRLTAIRENRGELYLSLQNRVSLRVDKRDRHYFAPSFPQNLKGQRIRVRGWISARDGQLRMRLRHPAEIEVE